LVDSSSQNGVHFHFLTKCLEVLQINVQQAAFHHCRFPLITFVKLSYKKVFIAKSHHTQLMCFE